MTISSSNSSVSHVGTGAQLVFSFDFEVDDASTLNVFIGGVLTLTGYTVQGVGNPSGGTVTFAVPPGNGFSVYLQRVLPLTQETDYTPYDSFPAESHEKALDKLTGITQQMQEQLNRVAQVPPGTEGAMDFQGQILRDIGNAQQSQDAVPQSQVTGLVQPYADSASASATAASNSASNAADSAASVVPNYVGEITLWSSVTAPLEYLLCNGAVYEQADYLALFQVIGTSFNTGGETGTQFRVPDIASVEAGTAYIIRAGTQSTQFVVPFSSTQDASFVGQTAFFHGPPVGWLQANGQTVSKTTFSDLWGVAQGFLTADQVANPGLYRDLGGDNFALPKLDGLFLRSTGTFDGNHIASALGSAQGDTLASHQHGIGAILDGGSASPTAYRPTGAQTATLLTTATGGSETRPANVALVACIRATRLSIVDTPTLNNFLNGMVGATFWKLEVPTGFVQANGQSISKSTYFNLWSYAQTQLTTDQTINPGKYRDIDASNFAVPNLSGMFIRGTGQVDANHIAGAAGAKQDDDNKAHFHTVANTGGVSSVGGGGNLNNAIVTINTSTVGGPEARPINVAMIPVIFAG